MKKQTRNMSDQLLPDKEFRQRLVRVVFEAGPRGVLLSKLIEVGIVEKWWQPTAAKHFGEKMRVAWSYGLIVLNEFPGTTQVRYMRVVHPFYFEPSFKDDMAQRWWDRTVDHLTTHNLGDTGEGLE